MTAACLTALVTIIDGGSAQATPVATASPTAGWTVSSDAGTVVVDTAAGTLTQEGNLLVIRDTLGNALEALPLTIVADGTAHPVRADVSAHSARLNVDMTSAAAQPVSQLPGYHSVDLPAAVAGTASAISLTAAVGGFLGAATGLIGGCLLGAVAAGVVSAPAALLFGAGPIAGCIGGAILVGAGASLGGTAIGGASSALANAQNFITLLDAPKPIK